MYISTFWIIVPVILIIYLLWRVYDLKHTTKEIIDFYDIGAKKKRTQIERLCSIICSINIDAVSKLPKKTQEKIINDESRWIYYAFKNNFQEGITLKGQYVPFETDIDDQLTNIFEGDVISEDGNNDHSMMQQLAEVLKSKLE